MQKRKNRISICLFLMLFSASVSSQEVQMSEKALLEQVYGEMQESQDVLPMRDLGVEFGYVLYQAEVVVDANQPVLEVENIRDYAAVYIDYKLAGRLTDEKKTLTLPVSNGKHTLQLYVENIGRITYGPEILDNSKGLFGSVAINGEKVENWKMIPLLVKECEVDKLTFTTLQSNGTPCFYRGSIQMDASKDTHLDTSGWGMGEVWVNGHYLGAFWEESSQQSIPVPASSLIKGENSVVVFELNATGMSSVRFTDKAVFK